MYAPCRSIYDGGRRECESAPGDMLVESQVLVLEERGGRRHGCKITLIKFTAAGAEAGKRKAAKLARKTIQRTHAVSIYIKHCCAPN